MSESVTILINAENKASAELTKVGNDLDGLAKRAKETGRNTKASVEVVGSLANAFGGTAIGAFSSQLGQLTEKVSAFSEIAKTGTAGAMAFKVGIVAAAGAVTYKVAETVAAWWFEIDKAKAKAAEAEKQFAAMSAAFGKARQKSFSMTREDLGLIRDPAEREQATNEAAARIEKQSQELKDNIARAQAEVERRQAEFNNQLFGDDTNLNVAKDQLANLEAMKAELDAEAESLRATTSERTKSIEARKAENALADKSDAFLKSLQDEIEMLRATKEEQLKLEAARNVTPENRSRAEALLAERELLKAKAEEQKKIDAEAELAAKKEEDAQKRIAELEKKRLIDLEARRIELEKGKEAAQAYRLEQEGLSRATAERLAAAEEQQRQAEDAASKSKNLEPDTAPQAALQARLLTRGTGGDPATQMINKLTELVNVQKEVKKSNDELSRELRQRGFTVKTAVIP